MIKAKYGLLGLIFLGIQAYSSGKPEDHNSWTSRGIKVVATGYGIASIGLAAKALELHLKQASLHKNHGQPEKIRSLRCYSYTFLGCSIACALDALLLYDYASKK